MKHCPNPGCPHAVSTGRLPEYDDHVDQCGDCKTALVDGSAPELIDDVEPLEMIAEFSNPHEAHLARAALASHGIEAVVDHDHTPYVSAISWVQLRVARSDAQPARTVLEEGPLVNTDGRAETGASTARSAAEPAAEDDMRPMRLSRRILLARWYLYGQAVSGFLAVPLTLELLPLSLALLVLAIGSLGLALWSHKDPRSALGVGVVVGVIYATACVALTGPVGALGFVPVLAIYFGWVAAGSHPPESLQARPRPTRSAEADIGDAWKEATPPESAPAASPRWKLAIGIVLAVVVLLVGGTALKRSPLLQKLVHGSTAFALLADPDAAVQQELELGLARVAHGLRQNEIGYEVLAISGRETSPAIQLEGTPPAASEVVNDLLERLFPEWKILPGTHEGWLVRPSSETRAEIIDNALEETLAGVRREFDITVQRIDRPVGGKINVVAELPGDRTLDEIRELLESPARLEMRPVHYPDPVVSPSRWLPPGSRDEALAMFGGRLPPLTELVPESVLPGVTVYWPVDRVPVVVGRDLRDASPATDDFGSPAISFVLTTEAGERLERATSQMVGRKMALILREEGGASVVAAPVIQSAIRTQGIIQGRFTMEEARLIASRMRAGSRAIPLEVAGPEK